MYVFDSSSIVNLIKKGLVSVFENGVTLDLALYESLNAVWKEHKLLGRIDEGTALKFANVIARVFEGIKVESLRGFEEEVLRIASKEGLTIYDASYLYLAIRDKLVLVTDDKKLKSKASKYVEVVDSNYMARKYLTI